MMEAHTSGTGLVDSIRVLTRLVESHTPFTWTAGFAVTKNRMGPRRQLQAGLSSRLDKGFYKILILLRRHTPTGVTYIIVLIFFLLDNLPDVKRPLAVNLVLIIESRSLLCYPKCRETRKIPLYNVLSIFLHGDWSYWYPEFYLKYLCSHDDTDLIIVWQVEWIETMLHAHGTNWPFLDAFWLWTTSLRERQLWKQFQYSLVCWICKLIKVHSKYSYLVNICSNLYPIWAIPL